MVTINGTINADIIKPRNNPAGNDRLEGDDIINGMAGTDDIDSGKGDDLINAGDGNDIARGGEDKDTINGNDGNDELFGDKGDDVIDGGDGDDFLNGGADKDTLLGGAGNDILNGVDNKQEDFLDGGDGMDFVDYRDARGKQTIYFDSADDSKGERSKDTWISIEGVFGSTRSSNTIYGSTRDDRIIGGDKKDKLYGDEGMDALEGRGGNDQLFGGAGFDILNGGRGSDKLTGGDDGPDIFYFEAGEIDGNDQILDFELGTDLVMLQDTGVTLDEIARILADQGVRRPNGDLVYTEPTEGGTITFKGVSYSDLTDYLNNGGSLGSVFYVGLPSFQSGGDNALAVMPTVTRGTRQSDTLEGGDGIDFLFGGRGRDILNGGAERDLLQGGGGRDILTGGADADRFVFSRNDRITDFSLEEGDKILFKARKDVTFEDLNIRQDGNDTIVSVGRAKLYLEDFTGTLTEDSFNFNYVRGESDIELL